MKPATFRHRNLPHLLLQARETLMAGFRPILRQHGMTEQQWRVVRTLNEQGEMEPNQLADACLILSPSLTRMLSSMEEAGLILRSRSTTDQRRQLISLTDKCRALIAEMEPLIDRRYEQLEQMIGAERLGKVYGAIDELLVSLSERDPQA
ncbi:MULTISPECIES: homoprotocatechuate degradation operon regulator HpaR [Cupriavidus]|uniref:Homoprotocatechuate degradation operon regulator HpaR n=1 Tax=Cupriavidus basilensis TaxID=68895 RepID=A0A643FJC0_9BURK|nr:MULTISPECIES: homoprotocatechuate degradation operon regulator HpaR [Cupriavidus]MBB1630069.1 homoprotocatechuate degradation operon regulator, HpaR [Cupriavidus sp. UME77]NUA25517.1 homoprotocatechuate degradation operon regulator HpaR [Cupriavidus basilensis]QOT77779.1 homoprotocatechuate degradation operon regulator HpaR [Cupriavidus basilensis]